jgi:Uma2 family endonuclease
MAFFAGACELRWSREEYYRLADLGFFRRRRVELIGGKIFEHAKMTPGEAAARTLTRKMLTRALGKGYWPREAAPLSLPGDSEPTPDIAVVPGGPRDYSTKHPTTALLIVEVTESPDLIYDQRMKGSLYASAGLQDYWIVNLRQGHLEVYRHPVPKQDEPYGHVYDELTCFHPEQQVFPLAFPKASLTAGDLIALPYPVPERRSRGSD